MIIPRYKRHEMEGKHFVVGNASCEGCGKTGESQRIIEDLKQESASFGVKINLAGTLLDKTRIFESNEICMNGTLIQDLLAAGVVATDCQSCDTLAGESTCCRTIEIGDERYEEIPPDMIKNAAYRAPGVNS